MAVEVFISFSHKDRKFHDELATHLSNLRNLGVINDWYDGDIPPGTEWKPQIMGHLQTAQTSWHRSSVMVSSYKRLLRGIMPIKRACCRSFCALLIGKEHHLKNC